MKIGITGVTGFIGRQVARQAYQRGYRVIAFSRDPEPIGGFLETRKFSIDEHPNLEGLDALVHLAGESIMGIWTPPKKRRIRNSRIEGTRRIVEVLNMPGDKPPIFVCGSAIGFYGDTGDFTADESCPPGTGFLADVAREWEDEANRANVRVVNLRTGFVIGRGGAMKLIGPVFRAGLGGRLGSGRQWMSCVHVEDVAGLILHAIEKPDASGPVNAVMPEPVRNIEFTRTLASIVHRPALVPAPTLALKVALGQLSDLLLDSQRVIPQRARELGYRFRYADLAGALGDAMNAET